MKAMGRNSVSSLVLGVLNFFAVLFAVVLVVLCAVLVFSATNGKQMVAVQIDSNGAPNFDVGWNIHMSIPVSFGLDPQTRVAAPALGVTRAELQNGQGVLRFVPTSGPFLFETLGLAIGEIALILWVMTQLRAVFRTLRDGQPFAASNATRVRRVAWALIGAEVLRAGLVYFANSYAATHFVADGLRFDAAPHLNLFAIFNGLVILVIAEVFRAGARLDEEQSLTV